MVASTGRIFLVEEGIEAYRRHLLPQALVATPNLWEAALLADRSPTGVEDVEAMADLARRIHELGPSWVLVKGGHLPGVESSSGVAPPAQVADVLFDGTTITVLTGRHVDTPNNHGTGCSLSAAIAAHLALGADVPDAVSAAKEFVLGALARWGPVEPRERTRAPGPPGLEGESAAGRVGPGVSGGPVRCATPPSAPGEPWPKGQTPQAAGGYRQWPGLSARPLPPHLTGSFRPYWSRHPSSGRTATARPCTWHCEASSNKSKHQVNSYFHRK